MNAIFLTIQNKSNIIDVYARPIMEALIRTADMDDTIYTQEEVLTQPEKFQQVRYMFATWGIPCFSAEQIRRCLPNLECVFYAAGSVQHFARPYMECGVKIFSAWAANAVPVSEYTLAQILLANKGFFTACRCNTSLENRILARNHSTSLPGNYGCKVGILGAGMIGKRVIDLLRPFDLEVLVYDPFLPEETAAALGVQKVDLDTLFSTCQTISNHVANLPATVGMLHGGLFSKMLPGATFINTGRGAQVVEEDLIRVLQERPDLTAVLDVTWPEPPVENSPFYTLPNCFLTPHIAGSQANEKHRMAEYMQKEFTRYLNGEPTLYEVSEKMLETMA